MYQTLRYQCTVCLGNPSAHPHDVLHGYCGHCHAFTGGGGCSQGWLDMARALPTHGPTLLRFGPWLVMETDRTGIFAVRLHHTVSASLSPTWMGYRLAIRPPYDGEPGSVWMPTWRLARKATFEWLRRRSPGADHDVRDPNETRRRLFDPGFRPAPRVE